MNGGGSGNPPEPSGKPPPRGDGIRLCDCLDGDRFWIVAQDGRRSDYVRNIAADPRVRVKGSLWSGGWRGGTAHILDDDDPAQRVRLLGRANRWRRLCLQASGALADSPLTVRIDLAPVDGEGR